MKLILINGPAGVGKSTLAARLHAALPLSLHLEVDTWRRFISGYKKHREESLRLAYAVSLAALDAYLAAGHDVIVDKMILESSMSPNAFLDVGTKRGAENYEIFLTASQETVLARIEARGLAEDSLLTREKAVQFFDEAERLRRTRRDAITIDTERLDPVQVCAEAARRIGSTV
jgi:predicted kinase